MTASNHLLEMDSSSYTSNDNILACVAPPPGVRNGGWTRTSYSLSWLERSRIAYVEGMAIELLLSDSTSRTGRIELTVSRLAPWIFSSQLSRARKTGWW